MGSELKKRQFLILAAIVGIFIFYVLTLFSMADGFIIQKIEDVFHRVLRDPARWIDVIQHTALLSLFALLNVYFLFYVRYGVMIRGALAEKIKINKQTLCCKETFKFFIFTALFLFFAYFNVITAHFFYADDVFRNYGGNRSWIGFSRYVSEFGSILIHNNIKLNDVAPLSQFIAIVVSSATVMVLSFSLTKQVSLKNCIALSAIFTAPCYVECFSYRFDSPYMAFSLFFAAIPFLFFDDKKVFLYVSVVCLLLTCISYQAALPLYILAAIYLFAKDFVQYGDLKKSFKSAIWAAVAFAIALVVFKLFFMNKMEQGPDDYFSSKIDFSAFFSNITEYLKITFHFHGGLFSKVLFILSMLYLIVSFVNRASVNKLYAFFLIVLVLVTAHGLSFGPYLLFSRPVFAPRAFMGFNTFVAFILLACLNINTNNSKKIPVVITFLSIYSFVVFLFTYGNCLKNQKEYENFRIQMIISDLAEDVTNTECLNVCFIGQVDFCQKNRVALNNYPVLSTLISRRPAGSSSWNDELLGGYNLGCECETKDLTDDFVLKKQTVYHDIYQNANDFIVVLK